MADRASSAAYRREARAFAVTWGSAAVVGLVPGLGSGCTVPMATSSRAEIRAIERVPYTDHLGADRVALRAGAAGGARLVYVHGSPSDATAFADQLVDPVPGFESISIDRPGYGSAADTGSVGDFGEQARALEPWLELRGGVGPILVGHSLGGPIIARAAADYPDRVGGLVIVAGSLDPALEKPRWFNHLASIGAVRWLLPSMLRVSNDEMLAAPSETRTLGPLLERVTCPVIIVHGTRDGLVPYENVAYMQRAFTNAASVEVITLEGQGHFLVWNTPGKAAIREAIGRLARTLGIEPVRDPAASGGNADRNR